MARSRAGGRGNGSGGSRPQPRSPLLFPNEDGNPYNRRSYHKVLARAGRRAGLENVRPHNLRSTAFTLMAEAGVPAAVCKEQLGWSDATFGRMVALYWRIQAGTAAESVRLLDVLVADTASEKVAR